MLSCIIFMFQCSLSCDGGVRTRDVFCMNLATRQTDRESLCEGSPFYEPMEECNTQECPGKYSMCMRFILASLDLVYLSILKNG